jgi:hypothetical protein
MGFSLLLEYLVLRDNYLDLRSIGLDYCQLFDIMHSVCCN